MDDTRSYAESGARLEGLRGIQPIDFCTQKLNGIFVEVTSAAAARIAGEILSAWGKLVFPCLQSVWRWTSDRLWNRNKSGSGSQKPICNGRFVSYVGWLRTRPIVRKDRFTHARISPRVLVRFTRWFFGWLNRDQTMFDCASLLCWQLFPLYLRVTHFAVRWYVANWHLK